MFLKLLIALTCILALMLYGEVSLGVARRHAGTAESLPVFTPQKVRADAGRCDPFSRESGDDALAFAVAEQARVEEQNVDFCTRAAIAARESTW